MQKRSHRLIQNVLLCSAILLSSAGCEQFKKLDIFSKPVERTPLNLDEPQPLKLETVKWIIVTEDNYKEVFADLKRRNKSVVLFGLTDDDYEVLSVNMAEIRTYIILNRDIIKKYKEYYESEGKTDGKRK